MELIIQPEVLFLDEATSGLDASTAVSVVKLLKRYGAISPVANMFVLYVHVLQVAVVHKYHKVIGC